MTGLFLIIYRLREMKQVRLSETWSGRLKLRNICQESAIGVQYLTHDVRVIRLPRHAVSCPVGMGVLCSADRNIKGKMTKEGIFVEQLEENPQRFLPAIPPHLEEAVEINLNKPMPEILAEFSQYSIKTG